VVYLFLAFTFQLFFDGVVAKVAQGVKESEIGYQMAFSKQELRKVISLYPGREVKKGLEALYKKVEKHLSDEGNLLQVRLLSYSFLELLLIGFFTILCHSWPYFEIPSPLTLLRISTFDLVHNFSRFLIKFYYYYFLEYFRLIYSIDFTGFRRSNQILWDSLGNKSFTYIILQSFLYNLEVWLFHNYRSI